MKIKKTNDLFDLFLNPNTIVCFEKDKVVTYFKEHNYYFGIRFDFDKKEVFNYSNKLSGFNNCFISEKDLFVILKILLLISEKDTQIILEKLNITELPLLFEFEPIIRKYFKLHKCQTLYKEIKNFKDYRHQKKNLKRDKLKKHRKEEVKKAKLEILNRSKVLKEQKDLRKKEIIQNHKKNTKNPGVKKIDLFSFDKGFNSIAEQFGLDKDIESKYENNNDFSSYFKPKLKEKRSVKNYNNITSLVIWDIENIHYFNDFSIITRLVKSNNQIKIVSFGSKFRNYYGEKIDFELNKLRKRGWIIVETKKIADNVLIDKFNKYKDKLEHLTIISNDSDFNSILCEALSKKITTCVYHRNKFNNSNNWFDKADFNTSLY